MTDCLSRADNVYSFVRISEQVSNFPLYIINYLVFLTVEGSVYCALLTDCLYRADNVYCFVRISEQIATFPLYIIN
jgi:hypothetical protein